MKDHDYAYDTVIEDGCFITFLFFVSLIVLGGLFGKSYGIYLVVEKWIC